MPSLIVQWPARNFSLLVAVHDCETIACLFWGTFVIADVDVGVDVHVHGKKLR